MTREQVETEMAQYRTIFTVVRLLDAAQVGGEESINSFCSCYSYWGKNTPCRNCISRQVLEDHRQRTKLEYMGSEVFQVTAVYREVDGAPCVMELVQKLDGEALIDPENGDRLIDSIASYHTKLYHDALTDSYNRRYFEDALKDKTDPAGVAVLDLDDFKLINDTNGHQAGDMALRTCVDVVRASIRKSDVLIRYGGDEFLLVLPGIERAAFLAKLDRIREQLHTASVPGYSRLQLSASIGGVITQPGETVEQAVSRADKLMYQAKNRKNMVVTEDNARDGALSAAGRESHSRQSILIVDDSEMNRAILAEILGSDYNILEATNGKECLAMLEQYGTSRQDGEEYVTQLGKDMAERTFLYADNLYAKLLTGLIHNTGLGRDPVVFLPDAPLRHVAESRGYTVTWDQESQSVTMVKGDTSYTVTLGSDICRTGDGQEITLTHYCYTSGGITYLPMDFIQTL